jgi:aminoglycoside 9-adenylyltransferase
MNLIETQGLMNDVQTQELPQEAKQAFNIIQSLLGKTVVAVYLFGSAVGGGASSRQ